SADAMLGIDVMYHVVVGGRLAPAHVSPVSAEHSSEVTVAAAKATARASKGGFGIRECPSRPAVGGAIHHVGAVAEATAHFIHAGNVNVACNLIAGALTVSDESAPPNPPAPPAIPTATPTTPPRHRDP